MVRTSLVTKNVVVAGKRTSVRLEKELWQALALICRTDKQSINEICTLVERRRDDSGGFTSALRVYIIQRLRQIQSR